MALTLLRSFKGDTARSRTRLGYPSGCELLQVEVQLQNLRCGGGWAGDLRRQVVTHTASQAGKLVWFGAGLVSTGEVSTGEVILVR